MSRWSRWSKITRSSDSSLGLRPGSPKLMLHSPAKSAGREVPAMAKLLTRRQVLTQAAVAAIAVPTLDPHELCCAPSAYAQTAEKDLFELKKVGDGVYAAIAATRYKVNCNAAVILTDDGVIVVDTHSKPSASRAVYQEIQ